MLNNFKHKKMSFHNKVNLGCSRLQFWRSICARRKVFRQILVVKMGCYGSVSSPSHSILDVLKSNQIFGCQFQELCPIFVQLGLSFWGQNVNCFDFRPILVWIWLISVALDLIHVIFCHLKTSFSSILVNFSWFLQFCPIFVQLGLSFWGQNVNSFHFWPILVCIWLISVAFELIHAILSCFHPVLMNSSCWKVIFCFSKTSSSSILVNFPSFPTF